MVVAIDGPAGSGKSSVSRLVAAGLGFAYLDTGALYRAVALAAELKGIDPDQQTSLKSWLGKLDIQARPQEGRFVVTLEGRDVEPFIRNEVIGDLASRLSARPEVRAYLLKLQRAAGRKGDLVAEGRDMGTVVFPKADCKFFLTASLQARAQRRLLELQAQSPGLTLESVLADMERRDLRDEQRQESPLAPARDAEVIDTTLMGLEEVAQTLLERVKAAMKGR